MTTTIPRRRVLRSPPPQAMQPDREILRDRYRRDLAQQREHLRRWMRRLKRAMTEVQKLQSRLARIEGKLAQLGG